jgi:hypothetical protein
MKHGVVTNGYSTTYYGNAAIDYMAQQWIANCSDNRRAAKFINEQKDGPYKEALIRCAKQMRMVEDAKAPGKVKAYRKLR